MPEVAGFNWELIGVIAATIVAAVSTLISMRAVRMQRQAHGVMVKKLAALDRDLSVLCSSASTAGDRLVHVERRSRELLAKQETIDTTGTGAKHYRHAHALLERGATADELVHTCGMARGEAELVAFLHQDRL